MQSASGKLNPESFIKAAKSAYFGKIQAFMAK